MKTLFTGDICPTDYTRESFAEGDIASAVDYVTSVVVLICAKTMCVLAHNKVGTRSHHGTAGADKSGRGIVAHLLTSVVSDDNSVGT